MQTLQQLFLEHQHFVTRKFTAFHEGMAFILRRKKCSSISNAVFLSAVWCQVNRWHTTKQFR